jgi:FKBP-type peptidyl-prolyl cis-trans isomerase SlyD
MSKLTVANNMVVSFAYVLRLDDGEEISRSESSEPVIILQGNGDVVPGLERSLTGMVVGEEKSVTVTPADGYGEHDPKNFERMPRSLFPDDFDLEEGVGLHLRDTESGELFKAYVAEIEGDDVLLDLNHPLAGETLTFDVRVTDIRAATAEEMEHGHVHSPGHEH